MSNKIKATIDGKEIKVDSVEIEVNAFSIEDMEGNTLMEVTPRPNTLLLKILKCLYKFTCRLEEKLFEYIECYCRNK